MANSIKISGTISINEEESKFEIDENGNFYQWGNSHERLCQSYDLIEKIRNLLLAENPTL